MKARPVTGSVLICVAALVNAGGAGQAPARPHASVHIEWDEATFTLIQRQAAYGRMIRLPNRDILCAYGRRGKVRVRRRPRRRRRCGEAYARRPPPAAVEPPRAR